MKRFDYEICEKENVSVEKQLV